MPEVTIAASAARDLRRIGPGQARDRLAEALATLAADEPHLDIKALVGTKGWLRLRVGDYRVLFWRRPDKVYVIARVVHRGKLAEAVASLGG